MRYPEIHAIFESIRKSCPYLVKSLDSRQGDELELEEQSQKQPPRLRSDENHRKPLVIAKIDSKILRPSGILDIRDPAALDKDHPFVCGLREAYINAYSIDVSAHLGKNNVQWVRKVSFANQYARL